jgi:2-keto-4-pentenoate hydratase
MSTLTAEETVVRAADRLSAAARSRRPCAPVRELIGDTDQVIAYEVQRRLSQERCASGRRIVGRKIGLTAPAVQKQLGVTQPDYGVLFDDMDVADGSEVSMSAVLQPKCEAEVAFVLRSDLDDERLCTADVISAIDYAVAAIEIVGSRIAGWDIRITDTIADNASSALFVLGQQPRALSEFDVRNCGMVLERRGDPVSTGIGAACLGSPINATLWLAKTLARRKEPLRRGDVVLSGALGPMVTVAPGDAFEARITGLGSVSVRFVAEG